MAQKKRRRSGQHNRRKITAVNAHGGFGKWAWDVALEPADVPEVLEMRRG
jgi:hypothetical protein